MLVRRGTEALCKPLSPEDCGAQSMPDASPVKWHLAHTSWFFETFVLGQRPTYRPFHETYGYLFNSYYDALGARLARPERGLLTRPSLADVLSYRSHVTERMFALLTETPDAWVRRSAVIDLIELGLQHEQQHQELIVTDLKHLFGSNPTRPVYRVWPNEAPSQETALEFVTFDAGVREVGHSGAQFAFDNEQPRHRVFVEPYALANRLVTNGEFLEFIRDGGYSRPDLWLSDGFRTAAERHWRAPLYWYERPDRGVEPCFEIYTLSGMTPIRAEDPVCHVSYYEADAYARWFGARLPTEMEWEAAAEELPIEGNLLESGRLHPRATAPHHVRLRQMFGDVWEWTASAYGPYPGYVPFEGAMGEYNGKFMCNQMVLRGGSCATPREHIRASYRNFFPPDARWQFSGVRLARST